MLKLSFRKTKPVWLLLSFLWICTGLSPGDVYCRDTANDPVTLQGFMQALDQLRQEIVEIQQATQKNARGAAGEPAINVLTPDGR